MSADFERLRSQVKRLRISLDSALAEGERVREQNEFLYERVRKLGQQKLDLLAENERLRSKVADLRDIAVDAGVERDQALATLDAVRKYADEREANGRRDRTVHSIRIASDLRRILNAADGGATTDSSDR